MFGGKREDYYDIHEFIDSSYHVCPDIRHRALLHNQFGLMLVERIFGQDILLMSFGDHVEVIVTPDGIETEEYEHD